MKLISAIAMSLMLIMIGLTAEAQAVTSGSYRCVALQGAVNGPPITPAIMHYNPNATGVQSIRRLRVFNSAGTLLSDQSFAPGANTVAGRGSRLVATTTTASFEGLTFLVNWSQTVDAAAPIPRLNLFTFDAANFTLAGQSNCP